ncbi:MAG TPA: hypothetical protein VKU38_14550 [Ktedonobacteraceae bacterium]|nr:hypothetical protein [Ktedonobacteraceae bacterium]
MKWSAALTPELTMIPDRSVFLRSSSRCSFTATVEGMTSDTWEMWEYAGDAGNMGNANNPGVADDADIVGDVEEVEGICCCTTHEPNLANKASQDRVLFV